MAMRRVWWPSKLCSVCSEIDFKTAFTPLNGHYDSSSLPEWLWFLEDLSLSRAQKQTSCPLCRMISKIAMMYPEAFYTHEQGSRGTSDRLLLSLSIHESHKGHDFRWYVPQLCVQSYQYIRILADPAPTSLSGSSTYPLLLGRRVGELVDVELAQKWLSLCSQTHSGACKEKPSHQEHLSSTVRVIDIRRRCLVELEPSQPYVTLSYVWGRSFKSQLRFHVSTEGRFLSEGGLADHHEDIPRTVKDAMKLCELLKRAYLWVDALCIKQDDPLDLWTQIKQMHHIYANSEFTIVATYGADSWAGLPGISKRHIKQHIEMIGSYKVVNGLKPFEQAVRESIWNTRAWTLQEMYFSRRLIYMTEFQAYFQCHTSIWQEDRFLEADPSKEVRAPAEDLGGMIRKYERYVLRPKHVREDRTLFKQYTDMVDGYAQRGMSDSNDALDAFAGIAGHFSALMDSEFIWGLPAAHFDRALLFTRRGPIHRNDGFPSWCWAGWLEARSTTSHSSQTGTSNEHPAWNEVPQESLILYNLAEIPHYNELRFFRVLHSEYNIINNSAIPKASAEEGLASHRIPWHPTTLPSLTSLPSSIPPALHSFLLVFATSHAYIPISYNPIQNRYALLSALTGAELSYITTDTDLITNNESPTIECVVLATVGMETGRPSPWRREYAGRVTLMAIAGYGERDGEAGSCLYKRLDLAWPPMEVVEWVAYKPVWQTVWLI